MWFGIFLTCLGILYLLRNAGVIYGDVWDWAWPILLICIGIGLILKPGGWRSISHRDKNNINQSFKAPKSD